MISRTIIIKIIYNSNNNNIYDRTCVNSDGVVPTTLVERRGSVIVITDQQRA